MAMRANISLDSASATKLRELAQLNIDSRDGFDYAAERIDDDSPAVAAKFRQWSDQRARFAEQLDGLLRGAGEEAQRMVHGPPRCIARGSIFGTWYRRNRTFTRSWPKPSAVKM